MADKDIDSDVGNLTASFIASSDMVYELFCEVCAEDDKHLEAKGFCVECRDYLCSDCIKHHGKNRASRNHTVQTTSQMPKQKPMTLLSKSIKLSCTEKCEHHPERLVEYYCRDDGSLACTVCLVKHRQCRAVDHISDISEHLLDSLGYQQFTASLTSLKTQSKQVIKSANENTTQAEKLFTDVAAALQELRRKVMKAFDTLQGNMIKTMGAIKSADVKKMKEIGDKGGKVLDEVEKISAVLQTLQDKNQLGQLFVKMTKLEDRIEVLHKLLHQADVDNNVTVYKFQTGPGIQGILDDPASIGSLSVQATDNKTQDDQRKPASLKTPASHKLPAHQKLSENRPAATASTTSASSTEKQSTDMNAVKIKDISVETKGDKVECWISGSVLLPGNKLILADCNNNKIKLLNLQTSKVTSILKVTSPWDVAIITEDQVAVTLCDVSKIAFVKVTSVLKLDRKISVDGDCTGIVHNNGKLIVAFDKLVKIEIMGLDGKVERKIECSDMFKKTSHMALIPGHDAIYVTDCIDHCVKRLSLNGKVKTVYVDEKLRCSRGVIVDQQGRVIVCGGTSGNLHLLTADLTKIKLLVDGLSFPQCSSLCHSTGRLYVGTRRGTNMSTLTPINATTIG